MRIFIIKKNDYWAKIGLGRENMSVKTKHVQIQITENTQLRLQELKVKLNKVATSKYNSYDELISYLLTNHEN